LKIIYVDLVSQVNVNSGIRVSERSVENVEAVVVRIFFFPTDLAHRLYTVSGKSLRYFRHIFDKIKLIFIMFGISRPKYSLY